MVFDLDFAYKLTRKFSVAVGLQTTSASFGIKQKVVSTVDIDTELSGYSFGYNIGLLYKSDNNYTVGLSLRSEVVNNIEGDIEFSNTPAGDRTIDDAEMKMLTPFVVNFGASSMVNKRIKAYGNITFTEWSVYEKLKISFPERTLGNGETVSDIEVNQDWKDTWMFSMGADVELDKTFSSRLGLALEQGAPDAIRSPTSPDTDRVIASLGLGMQLQKLKMDVSFSSVFYE